MSEEAPPLKRAITLGVQQQTGGTCFAHTSSRIFCKLVKNLLPDRFDAKETCASSGVEMQEDYIKTVKNCADEKFKNYVCLYSYVVETIKVMIGCNGYTAYIVMSLMVDYTSTFFMLGNYIPNFRTQSWVYRNPLISEEIDSIAKNLLQEFVLKREQEQMKIVVLNFNLRGDFNYGEEKVSPSHNWIKSPGKNLLDFINLTKTQNLYSGISVHGNKFQIDELENQSLNKLGAFSKTAKSLFNKVTGIANPIIEKNYGSGGHAMVIKDWNFANSTLTILNTWGSDWGNNGTTLWGEEEYNKFNYINIYGILYSNDVSLIKRYFSYKNNPNVVCVENYRNNQTFFQSTYYGGYSLVYNWFSKTEIIIGLLEKTIIRFRLLLDILSSTSNQNILKIATIKAKMTEFKSSYGADFFKRAINEVKLITVYLLLSLLTIRENFGVPSINEAKHVLKTSDEIFDEDFIKGENVILTHEDLEIIKFVKQQPWFKEFRERDPNIELEALNPPPLSSSRKIEYYIKAFRKFIENFDDEPDNISKVAFQRLYLTLVGHKLSSLELDNLVDLSNPDVIDKYYLLHKCYNSVYPLEDGNELKELRDAMEKIYNDNDAASDRKQYFDNKIAEIKEKMATVTLEESPPEKEDRGGNRRTKKRRRTRRLNTRNRRGRPKKI
jgi:hypothetical protein